MMEWGKNDIHKIIHLCYRADQIQSKIDNKNPENGVVLNKKQRYRHRKARLRVFRRVRFMIDECHKKLVKFLCGNYRVILWPDFRTSEMLDTRKSRKINSKTAR